jgi:hypothetical protein
VQQYTSFSCIWCLHLAIDSLYESSYLLQAFEETPTHTSIKINQLEEGHNSYPLVCGRPAETSGQLSTKIYDKRDDFNFKTIKFPNMCSNIPASPAYGVYISQLIRYARTSSNYPDDHCRQIRGISPKMMRTKLYLWSL